MPSLLRPHAVRAIRLFCYFFLMALSHPCLADTTARATQCQTTDVTVHAEKTSDVSYVCSAAERTFSFLKKAGFTTPVSIDVYVVDQMVEGSHPGLYFGKFKRQSKKVYVLSFSRCKKLFHEECFCGLRLHRNLHTSFIIHELAHAVADASFSVKNRSVAAEEYIAYTTQITLMDDDLRQLILANITNEGFGHEREITSLFHDLNPSVFAIKAYRHFLCPENGNNFYRKLLSGQCKLDGDE